MTPPSPENTSARGRRLARPALASLAAALWGAALAGAAAVPTPAPRATGIATLRSVMPLARSTPRESITGFLVAGSDGDFRLASLYLDLGGLSPETRAAEGPSLARRLYLVLLRRAPIDPETVSDTPLGSGAPGTELREEHLATLVVHHREVPVSLELATDPAGARLWLVSRDTVGTINALYRAHGYGVIGDLLPSLFFSLSILGLQLWQWVGLAVALLFGYGVARLLARALLVVFGVIARRTTVTWDDALVKAMDGPLAIVLWGLALTVTSSWVGLPPNAVGLARAAWRLLTLFGIGWILFRVWDGFTDQLQRRTDVRDRITLGYVPIISRAGKFIIAVFILLAALDVIGINVVAMLAGIGIGGVAIAFAAQKTIENVFGAVTIASDRPFMVGDFVTIDNVTGTIEEIGLRSTRLRTLDRTLVTIPNGPLAAGTIVNFTQRDRFLFNPTLGVRYDSTTEQLTWIIDEIRKMLLAHPKVFQETQSVRFSGFGPTSLKVEVLVWTLAKSFNESTAIAEELNFAIARIVERSGTSFALPSQTLFLGRDSAPDRARADAVAGEVAQRRDCGELAVPEPPPGPAEKLRTR
ncbi:MAG: mechanosensitive ion channel family protein [Thermoanaerobaculaceae bacterium]|jgi:MscS family membrane protein